MTDHSSPTSPSSRTTAAATVGPRSAAEHYAAAETWFVRAREMHPHLSSRAADQDAYRKCMDWAGMHLRLAEALTAGAAQVATQLRLKADGYRLNTALGSEAYQWDTLLRDIHSKPGRTA
ncbi:hypothetical protein [Amycolatopsis vastitatis]|uniref:hypothetical protein n=1 Tax=Amycolatopsis vastitatis TaxID=1905142 RepID=UPI00196ABC83|nr:hypothetical protein [Amycolatopsis vastitatis]